MRNCRSLVYNWRSMAAPTGHKESEMDDKVDRALALVGEAQALLREVVRERREAARDDRREVNKATADEVALRVRQMAELEGMAPDTALVVLAHRAGMDHKTLERWRSGESKPRVGNVERVNKALAEAGVDPVKL